MISFHLIYLFSSGNRNFGDRPSSQKYGIFHSHTGNWVQFERESLYNIDLVGEGDSTGMD